MSDIRDTEDGLGWDAHAPPRGTKTQEFISDEQLLRRTLDASQARVLEQDATIAELRGRLEALDDALSFEPDEQHSIADMANVGHALMQTISQNYENYSYNNCPSEIVCDLINERDEARGRLEVAEKDVERMNWLDQHTSLQMLFKIFGAFQITGAPVYMRVLVDAAIAKEQPERKLADFVASQQDLPADMAKALHDNRYELYEKSTQPERKHVERSGKDRRIQQLPIYINRDNHERTATTDRRKP